MTATRITPVKALNKAYRKVKPVRKEIDLFKQNLIQLLDGINEQESEEFHKNLVIAFLKKTYYDPDHFINTKGRSDLVIHNGKKAKSPVGVLIETKKPTNTHGMIQVGQLNAKATQELVLYYLRERITHKNDSIRYVIATNIYEWFIFDAQVFDKCFAQDKRLVKKFQDFESKRLPYTDTDNFYRQIAAPAIDAVQDKMEYTHFDIRQYDRPLRNDDPMDDNKLIALFKIFSPQHLLKLPFANDSNSLDKAFYTELLHIIGLDEVKEGGKKLIKRKKAGQRDAASLLENTIDKLDTLGKLSRIQNIRQYGENREEQLFAIGLELVITWINRILFLKLMEAQLLSYHRGDKKFRFLDIKTLKDFDQVEKLFFSVLARKTDERSDDVREKFQHIPYLNSSLFEPQSLEHEGLFVSQLEDDKALPIHPRTVLKENSKKKTGTLNALQYLFDFLDAYDFSSEGGEDIQEDNKSLINASVLGLIFEKINGYKDGSFFTPGFITMYMCRETIRRAVIQKFNEKMGWSSKTFDDLREDVNDFIKSHPDGRKAARKEANALINDLKICDPAVGSGHFLVSSLNEIIAIKHDLHILHDRKGNALNEYRIEVENDELIITNELLPDTPLFEYHPDNQESQRVQEALFHEKQNIIENCLFGVDINPNSVKICQLRLWIELLKNAYYTGENELETLPNIDINIKCGNSLISRFNLDTDLKDVFTKKDYTVEKYLSVVNAYKDEDDKESKRKHREYINNIKQKFKTALYARDKRKIQLSKLRGQLNLLENKEAIGDLFGKLEEKDLGKNKKKLEKQIGKLETDLQQEEDGRFYDDNNAFEWRFEFPEVLDEDGNYRGFDVGIANPPYIRQEELSTIKPYLSSHYKTYKGTADIYVYFVELAMKKLVKNGEFIFIIPNKWMRAGYGSELRAFIKSNRINFIHDFGDLPVFEEATTYPCILSMTRNLPNDQFYATNIDTLQYDQGLDAYLLQHQFPFNIEGLQDQGWTLTSVEVQNILEKMRQVGAPLGEYVDGKIFYGIKTGLNEAFVIDEETKERLIKEDPKSVEIIKPFLGGRNIKRYETPVVQKYLILFKNGQTKELFGDLVEEAAWNKISALYPAICNHLIQYKTKAKKRYDQGQYWWELRACDYYHAFENEKIIYPNICKRPEFLFDNEKNYTNQKCFIIDSSDLNLLGILNSHLYFFLFQYILPKLRGDFYEPSSKYFLHFPIVEPSNNYIRDKVKDIIYLKSQNQDTSALESEIDLMVYKLYGLTYKEVKVVDGEFWMSEEEYENYRIE